MNAVVEAREPSARYLAALGLPLLAQFDLVAQAANGVARLRELILLLAVQGKLVPQDPNDEPASVLLERIRAEKARLVKEGKIRKSKPLPEIIEGDATFELPFAWEWVRLGDLGDWGAGATPSRSNGEYYGGDIPWFKSGELTADFISDAEEHITSLALKECSLRENSAGDVLIAMYGATIGKASILSRPATTNQAVCACTPYSGLSNRYLLLLLKALKPYFVSIGAGGAQPNISREKIIATVVGVPPLAEQSRIVARVEELMALCDSLEAKGKLEAEQHARLVGSLFDSLASSESAHTLAENWQRIATYFDLLLDRPSAVDVLEQTILQLAIRGLLVPQDPTDEPASVLLQKIRAEKDRLIATGQLKRDSRQPSISNEEKPFEPPKGWEWVALKDLLPEFQNGVSSRGDVGGKSITVLRLADIKKRRISLRDTREIPINERDAKKYGLLKGDILIVRVNGSADIVGQFILNDDDLTAIYCDHFIRMRIDQTFITPDFLSLLGESDIARSRIQSLFITTAGQKTVNQSHIRSLLLPLPPLPEQSRIVARVSELRALCAQLRDRIAITAKIQSRLSETLIEKAVA